jgi:hypothetical protein
MSDNHGGRWPADRVDPDAAYQHAAPETMGRGTVRPPECFEYEDVYKWLLAEAHWLLGEVKLAAHRIRLRENVFGHDSVQRDADNSV